ncbi:hypothetical protein PSTG_04073 [Puccinia striiformis f. sp. tritici PST-78]|uniref:BED-type domain-containing protein n=1 Tax=Puccinia striiformis f. sp. tritici PST-78 TaxID=1165861 RepID=A0A0L0VU25_9BASI|nr:hypothetical protein PSTG_04073 [Puccinia striiformis f. sp. tritici PST-78]
MAPKKSKKRHKPPGSPTSSIASTPAAPMNHSRQKKRNDTIVNIADSDEEPPAEDLDSTTPASTQTAKGRPLTDEQELKKARRVHKAEGSDCYIHYHPPQISTEAKDKNGQYMISYTCKHCGHEINRPRYDSSPSNLSKHVAGCKKDEASKNQKLTSMGISGTGDVDARDVPQLCAIWCAEGARPFSALGEQAHQGIMHPTVVQNLPTQKAVSNDIG